MRALRRFHLGMWSRTVIVLSAAWMVAGTNIHFNRFERDIREIWMAGEWACLNMASERRPVGAPPNPITNEYCVHQAEEASRRAESYFYEHLKNAVLQSLGEVAMGWIAALLAYWAVRWILAGRSRKPGVPVA